METDLLCVAVAEQDFSDCIQGTVKLEVDSLRNGNGTYDFCANSTTKPFSLTYLSQHKKHDKAVPKSWPLR